MHINDIVNTTKIINCSDWDSFVTKVYGKIYSFQQQNGCREKGNHYLSVSKKCPNSNDGVSFNEWLKRDPKQPLKNQKYDFELYFWWRREFYPDVEMVAYDLYKKGLMDAGNYCINIDW